MLRQVSKYVHTYTSKERKQLSGEIEYVHICHGAHLFIVWREQAGYDEIDARRKRGRKKRRKKAHAFPTPQHTHQPRKERGRREGDEKERNRRKR